MRKGLARSRWGCALWVGAVATVISISGGCSPPTVPSSPDDPIELRAIREEYTRLVDKARHDPVVNWHSGWLGNVFVNHLGGENRGLCYQWQEYIYLGVLPTVRRVGWRATGLAVNEDNGSEHHCVIIWDPKKVREENILGARRSGPVYVLDAWHDGEPDVHWIDDWLDAQRPYRSPPRLQSLPVATQPAPTPGPWESPKAPVTPRRAVLE